MNATKMSAATAEDVRKKPTNQSVAYIHCAAAADHMYLFYIPRLVCSAEFDLIFETNLWA